LRRFGAFVERELSLLHMANGVLDRPFATLSNGEQTKVLLLRSGWLYAMWQASPAGSRRAAQC